MSSRCGIESPTLTKAGRVEWKLLAAVKDERAARFNGRRADRYAMLTGRGGILMGDMLVDVVSCPRYQKSPLLNLILLSRVTDEQRAEPLQYNTPYLLSWQGKLKYEMTSQTPQSLSWFLDS